MELNKGRVVLLFFQLPHVASTRTSGNLEPILVHGIWTESHIWSPRSYSHPKIYIYNSHSPRRFLTLRKTNIAGWKMENRSSNGKCYRRAFSSIHYWRVDLFIEKKKHIRILFQHLIITLQGINISHLGKRKIIFPTAFGWDDMLVPWRVRVSVSSPVFLLVLFGCLKEPLDHLQSADGHWIGTGLKGVFHHGNDKIIEDFLLA